MMKFLTFLIFVITLPACHPKITYLRISDVSQMRQMDTPVNNDCNDPLNYIPDSNTVPKIVRVNVHFFDDSLGKNNFTLEEGRIYMKQLIHNANERLRENHKMNLPEGNDTPALNPRFQYRITGAGLDASDDGFYRHLDKDYFFYLNKGRYRNNYDRSVIKKYALAEDSILNIFVFNHHPDSLNSAHYVPNQTGIALGTTLKIAGMYENKDKPWSGATLLNHEVGHILGLSHSWTRSDGCEDTPPHPNCWDIGEEAPCQGPISNNMMDYNNSQMAITPCQLGIVHRNFSREDSRNRDLLLRNWCRLDTSSEIIIRDTVEWRGEKDLTKNIIIEEDAVLKVYCRISMPAGGKIIVKKGGELQLLGSRIHNSCGEEWEGIFLETSKKSSGVVVSKGRSQINNVQLTVNN